MEHGLVEFVTCRHRWADRPPVHQYRHQELPAQHRTSVQYCMWLPVAFWGINQLTPVTGSRKEFWPDPSSLSPLHPPNSSPPHILYTTPPLDIHRPQHPGCRWIRIRLETLLWCYDIVRDVCAEGFDLTDTADAVFLDLPHPWTVVPHAKTALKVSPKPSISYFRLWCSLHFRTAILS